MELVIREITDSDFDGLQELYLHLHGNTKSEKTGKVKKIWDEILGNKNYHILIGILDNKIISSVTLVVVPNLTHGAKPYTLIENVVTHPDHRGKGYATALMNKACNIAKENGCYKVMLLTGSKLDSTLRFYENRGFNRKDKTAFIKWIGEK
jgi:GNAT superfamily N-acetyltransferase